MKTKHNKHLISQMDTVIKKNNLVDEVRDFVSKLKNVSIYKGRYIIVKPDNVAKLEQKAALIAAAPELLEVVATIYNLANLQTLLETKYSKALVNDIMKQMENAINKARGE